MKNKMQKKIFMMGMLCAICMAAACGGTDKLSSAKAQQEDEENFDVLPEQTGQPSDDETQNDASSKKNAPAAWSDNSPDFEGGIKELENGRITVVKAITEDRDDGSKIIAAPAAGADDSEFEKIAVTYDENTLFAIRTIYDGGARSEMSEATAADMAEGQSIQVWGQSLGEEWAAEQICMIKVE